MIGNKTVNNMQTLLFDADHAYDPPRAPAALTDGRPPPPSVTRSGSSRAVTAAPTIHLKPSKLQDYYVFFMLYEHLI